MTYLPNDRPIARLLRFGHFEKREDGGWRFGTKRISDVVIARLIESGAARVDGLQLVRIPVVARAARRR